MNLKRSTITTTLFMTIVLALGTGCPSGRISAPRAKAKSIDVVIDATDLAAAYEADDNHANTVYGQKWARISGRFAKSEPLADGHIAMIFRTSPSTFRPVRCVFDTTDSIELNELTDGASVTVTGIIVGFTESRYFVTVEDCVIEKEQH